MIFHFDRLAVHPPPRPGESLTGYLTFLMEENGMRYFSALNVLFSPMAADLRWQQHPYGDVPLTDAGPLQALTGLSDQQVAALTWQPMCRQFDVEATLWSMKAFLRGWIAPMRRYCPRCLGEERCYALAWGVQVLPGCHKHDCRLWEGCHACGKAIPYLTVPFQVGSCPHCQAALHHAEVIPLTPAERVFTHHVQTYLGDLLSDKPWLLPPHGVCASLGQALLSLVRERKLDLEAFAQTAGIAYQRLQQLGTISEGSHHRLTLRELWQGVSTLQVRLTELVQRAQQKPDVAALMTTAIQRCFAEGRRPFGRDIARSLGISRKMLRSNDPLLTLAHELVTTLTRAHQEAQVRDTLCRMREDGERISYKKVAKRCGINTEKFRLTPAFWQLVVVAQQAQQEEEQARDRQQVDDAIQQLVAGGIPVSLTRISQFMGRTSYYLTARADLMERIGPWCMPLSAAIQQRRVAREDGWYEQMVALVPVFQQEQIPLTAKALARRLGVHPFILGQCPRIMTFIRTHHQDRVWQVVQQTEDMRQMLDALAVELTTQQVPLTFTRLATAVRQAYGGSRRSLAVLGEWMNEHCPESLAEAEVFQRVVEVTQAAEAVEDFVTTYEIGQRVGISAKVLRHYPTVESELRRFRRARKIAMRGRTSSEGAHGNEPPGALSQQLLVGTVSR